MHGIIRRKIGLPTELDEFFDSFMKLPAALGTQGVDVVSQAVLPVDLSETDDEIVVRASLPGFAKDDVEVEVHDGVLSIKASREEEVEQTGERFYRKERREGAVSRRIALPGVVDEGKTNATLRDGVLEVRVAKSNVQSPKRVNIS